MKVSKTTVIITKKEILQAIELGLIEDGKLQNAQYLESEDLNEEYVLNIKEEE